MRSKLVSRIMVVACVLVMGGLSLLGGTQMKLSKGAWNQIIESLPDDRWQMGSDVSLTVDAYDSQSESVTVAFSGTASSPAGEVSVVCYRCNDIGQALSSDEVGELGALRNEYPAEMNGDTFRVSDIHLKNGENHFLIVATDAAGTSAKEAVRVDYSMGQVVPVDRENVAVNEYGESYQNNLVALTFKPGTTAERAREIIAAMGASEVGSIPVLRRYQIQIAAADYAAIQALCDGYLAEYEELLTAAPEMVTSVETNSEVATPNDPWDPRETDAAWDESLPMGANWNLECIQAQSAWAYTPYFRSFTVGVIDAGFADGHDDLRLYFGDDRRVVDDHGTHIAGTIGALHNNGTGLCGVMNKGRLFAYPLNARLASDGGFIMNDSELLYSLVSCVLNGSSVINVSLGSGGTEIREERQLEYAAVLGDAMCALLSEGYDFLVVQAAGNGDEEGNAIDAVNSGWYISLKQLSSSPAMQELAMAFHQYYGIQPSELSERVIVVANARNLTFDAPSFELAPSSNCGEWVDIAAPGTNIYSTLSGGTLGMGSYGLMSGTSMAAPHVAAVAAMAWSTNPDITGADVRKILMENTCYTASSPEGSSMPGYTYPIVNAKLAVEAAIRYERVRTYADITISDAQNGQAIPGASVAITCGVEPGGPLFGTYIADSQGRLYLEMDSGDYVLDISCDGYISMPAAGLHLDADRINKATYSISRALGERETRIVLNWGASPNDLDSHLIGYEPTTERSFRVCYASKVVSNTDGEPYAFLDVDDTSSFGPETITIYDLPTQPLLYSVHDYTNRSLSDSLALSGSNATVTVLRHNEILATYTVSPNRSSVEWNVCWIMPDGSVVPCDEYQSGAREVTQVGLETYNLP